jgi:hypothetical protein
MTTESTIDERRDAYRAAGQAASALASAAPISGVDSDGIEIEWEDYRSVERPRGDVIADAFVGLCGVVAVSRWGYGRSTSDSIHFWNFNELQFADLAIARSMLDEIDPDDEADTFFQLWCQALDMIGDEATWRSIVKIAEAILISDGISLGELDSLLLAEPAS